MLLCALLLTAAPVQGDVQDNVHLFEAEALTEVGGWKIDTQFAESVGSPFLLAHGLGQPVEDATGLVRLPDAGLWYLWVRTYDWVARWEAQGAPGRFRVIVDGEPVGAELGTEGTSWGWQRAGSFECAEAEIRLALRDSTGFDGRCDALLFARSADYTPPAPPADDFAWRQSLDGRDSAGDAGSFDLVVVGGGAAGTAATIAAARMGLKVALIQDRPVLGGNGSSEVRVWMKGHTRRGRYPHVGEIVEELADNASASPGRREEFADARKEAVLRSEPNASLFLLHRAQAVEMEGDRIKAVRALDVRQGVERRFQGTLFADCTGHGELGFRAGADHTLRRTDHLGASNMWRWADGPEPSTFEALPWALELELDDFPYPRGGKGEWFWESGFDLHPIDELEAIRDWNLRALYGAFHTMKNGPRAAEHERAQLVWAAYVAGTRESRQLLGDVVLSRDDIVDEREFLDGCVPTTWSIDLHYPRDDFSGKYRDNPFISRAEFDRSVDEVNGYAVPYRCFYSRNVPNLLMAGRCVSVTHQALGTVRVMRTGGMMGEVIGKAASVAIRHEVLPREVYSMHWSELRDLLELPGGSRRAKPQDEPVAQPSPAWDRSGEAAPRGIAVATLPGIIVDDKRAKLTGDWVESTHEPGFVGERYLHDGNDGKGSKTATFTLRVREAGRYSIGVAWRGGGNRAAAVPIEVRTRASSELFELDQSQPPPANGFFPLTEVDLEPGVPVLVVISTADTRGHVIVDAVQALRQGE